MSPSEYEYLFILTALKDSGLVDVSEQGISLTAAGESLMQQLSEGEREPWARDAHPLDW